MSSDRKLIPGQPLRGIPARTWNRFVDAAARVEQLGSPRPQFSEPVYDVLVKNNTGTDLAWYQTVGVPMTAVTPATGDTLSQWQYGLPLLDGKIPTLPTYDNRFGVLQVSIADGEIGRCRVSGMTVAEMDNTSTPTDFANVADSSHLLTFSDRGARVVCYDTDPETSKRWALIKFSGSGSGLSLQQWIGQLTSGNLPSGSKGTFAALNPQDLASLGFDIEAWNHTGKEFTDGLLYTIWEMTSNNQTSTDDHIAQVYELDYCPESATIGSTV